MLKICLPHDPLPRHLPQTLTAPMSLTILDTSYQMNHIVFVLLSLAYITLHNVFIISFYIFQMHPGLTSRQADVRFLRPPGDSNAQPG